MDKTHIDKIAQQVLQIANRDIENAFGENGGCVRDTRTEFITEIDHIDIADIVYPGYTLWYDEYGDIGARCEVLIVVDVFTEVNAHIDDIKLYRALNVVMRLVSKRRMVVKPPSKCSLQAEKNYWYD